MIGKMSNIQKSGNTIQVTVFLYGKFRKPGTPNPVSRTVPEDTTVGDLLELMEIPPTIYRMALVNGIRVKDDHSLRQGDEVHIFQPIGGG